jgi:type II secretory pathway pseudopilin PulG
MALGLIGLLLVVGAGFVYFSQTGQRQALQRQLATARQALEQDRKQVAQQAAYAAAYAAAQQELSVLEKEVVPSEFIATLLDQVEDLAREANLRVGAFQPVEPPPKPKVPEEEEEKKAAQVAEEEPTFPSHEVDLTLHGDFNAVLTLLERLQQFRKAMGLERLEIKSNPGSVENPAEVNAMLHLIVYEMAPGEPAKNGQKEAKHHYSRGRVARRVLEGDRRPPYDP